MMHSWERFQKFPSFSILDGYPWDLSEVMMLQRSCFIKESRLIEISKAAVVGVVHVLVREQVGRRSHSGLKRVNCGQWFSQGLIPPPMAALQNGGRTVAVIGTGLMFLSEANKRLQNIGNRIWYPAVRTWWGTLEISFPARNRIIAGLCRGVIVAEAKDAFW